MHNKFLLLTAQSLLAAACFTPDAPADTDADMASTSGGDSGSAGVSMMPSTSAAATTNPGGASASDSDDGNGPQPTTTGSTGVTTDLDDSGSSDDGASTRGSSDGASGDSSGGPLCTVDPDQGSSLEFDHVILPPWQSFTTGMTGDLVEIDAMPNTYCGGVGIDGELRIYAGEGTGGAMIYANAYPAMFVSGLNLTTFHVDPPLAVEAGLTYTWELTGTCGLRYGNGNPYAGGVGGGNADLDMVFETRIETCQ
ncbi:MAG: hypothetical protein K0V04_03570 [Deltaproteobacteria bacterium]|nr:hypothetical protein [Deltaproteobacteria bacterium]